MSTFSAFIIGIGTGAVITGSVLWLEAFIERRVSERASHILTTYMHMRGGR